MIMEPARRKLENMVVMVQNVAGRERKNLEVLGKCVGLTNGW
jgi:hypothetical protein